MQSPNTNGFTAKANGKQAEIAGKLMELYKSNARGRGVGEGRGVKFNQDKNKCEFEKGTLYWVRGAITVEDWVSHLAGQKFLGLGPILDDGMVWWASIDVDQIEGDNVGYSFDGLEIVTRVYQSKLPLVPDWSKSGGIHLKIFFTEPVEAELVRRVLTRMSAQLGLSGCEIFPKQSKLESEEDCPSWMFMPYGPIWGEGLGQMAEQCGIGANGGSMDIEEYINACERAKIGRAALVEFTKNADAPLRGRPQPQERSGRWAQSVTLEETRKDTFNNGPPCLFSIATISAPYHQHDYLIACATFLRKKYGENWEEALRWVNFNILRPAGDPTKLEDIIKSVSSKEYEYRCKNAPIVSYCDSHTCRMRKFGVGSGSPDMKNLDFGLTILIGSDPQIWIFTIGDHRFRTTSDVFMDMRNFRKLCLEKIGQFPGMMKLHEWDEVVRRNRESANLIDPPVILKANANEYEIITKFLYRFIPHWLRARGDEFLHGQAGEKVRIRIDRKRVWFKWADIKENLENHHRFRKKEIEAFRHFLHENATYHERTDSLGGFFRSTYSMAFEQIPEIKEWLGDELPEDPPPLAN